MIQSEKTQLTKIFKDNIYFKQVFENLIVDKKLTLKEQSFILSCSLLFLGEYQKNRNYKSYADLAYYITLKYSLNTADYKPLFDIATVLGFYPITYAIINNNILFDPSFTDFSIKYKLKDYEKNENKSNIFIETYEQNSIRKKLIEDYTKEKAFIAPTSYGKSSVIVDYIKSNLHNKIAIIVPTKSLLLQTYKMIREAKLDYKILMHDEMYNHEKRFIAVFTQERALRLIKSHDIYYDSLIIDEAHNLFESDNRSLLLGRLIRLNRHYKFDCNIIYLSPLIEKVSNLTVSSDQNINLHAINFNIKSPELYEYTIDNKLLKHNRFFINDKITGIQLTEFKSYFELINNTQKDKNFIYNYRPIHIEDLAKKLINILPRIAYNTEIEKIIKILEIEVHDKFYISNLIRYGVIYLHGKIPDLIKEYLEFKFRTCNSIKFVVANSVILEGMNLPIDNLYIFNTRGLYGKELTNLVGRVNRLNEIFKKGNNLKKLVPEIFFVNNIEYNKHQNEAASMFNKIKLLRNRSFSDEVKNPLLENFDIEKVKDKDQEKQKIKRNKISQTIDNENYLLHRELKGKEKIKQYFIENSFDLFYHDITSLADLMNDNLEINKFSGSAWENTNLIDKVFQVFIQDYTNNKDFFKDFEFYRLKELLARNYYNRFLQNRKKSLKENVTVLFNYLKMRKKTSDNERYIFYIGTSYGEIKYQSDQYFDDINNSNVAIDLRKKTDEELINYAIVKLKMEDEFISFKLNKFIVFLYDFKLISQDEYHNYIYGTTDQKKISLTKFGLGINLIERLTKDNQINNLKFDQNNNLISNDLFREYLSNLNEFQKFEIERFIY